jgi:hypothetical protein
MIRTAATILGCAALVAGCGQEPQPGARAFNARQEAIRRDVEARSRVRIVAPPGTVNGGYAAMPGDLPRAAPTPVATAASSKTVETDYPAGRDRLDGQPAKTQTTGRPTRMDKAALARAIAAAERRRVETMSVQDASLRRVAAEARTRQKARDAIAAKRFETKVAGAIAPAKGSLSAPPSKTAAERKEGTSDNRRK